MTISWRRAAAVILCAVCTAAAAPGMAGLTAIPTGLNIPSAIGHVVSPHVEPASASTPVEPLRAVRLREPDLSTHADDAAVEPVASAAAPSGRAARSSAPGPAPVAMLWPSLGTVTSRFGWRVHPIFGGREFHTGMDIAARTGTPVVAARTGVVKFVGWKTGYGRIIVVEHDGGIETWYSHLSAAVVNPGDHVTQGQVIGRVGSTGWSTGPHVLFEVRRNGVPVDPAPYLN